jgi:hypothetical protein
MLNRFTCPSCGKVIKARAEWAGRSAKCPFCQQPFTVPAPAVGPGGAQGSARMSRQLAGLVAEEQAAGVEDHEAERLALLLAQGACREYQMAIDLIARRKMPARQWRRILGSAGAQELLREKVEQAAALESTDPTGPPAPADPADADDIPIALLVASEPAAAADHAWTILARLLYFLSHGPCDGCKTDISGMSCMYLSIDRLIDRRAIAPDRLLAWRESVRQHVGI